MDEGNDFCIGILLQGGLKLLGIDCPAPGLLHDHSNATNAGDVFDHTPAKNPVLADYHFVAWFYQIDKTSLHTRGARR